MRVLSEATGLGVSVQGLTHIYAEHGNPLVVLDQLDLALRPAEHLAVTGRSGAGKSTLLAVLGGLERPQSGSVLVGDVDLARLDGDELAAYRRDLVGFVFQHYGLLGNLTALENIELAMTFTGLRTGPRRRRARELLDAVGLAERADHRPNALSGGEAQRVAIARALANQPRLVLADEPTGNLDDENTAHVLDLLASLPAQLGCTLVVVTHNHVVAARAARRCLLEHGRVVAVP
jgi:putative ABC transport system ATP-binding protein